MVMDVDKAVDHDRTLLLRSTTEDSFISSSSYSSINATSPDAIEGVSPKSTPREFPWRPVISILLLAAVQPIGFEIIFPFVNQMIVENGIVQDPERVGFYSGVIESLFSCMSFLTIIPCSIASDHLGRKPVVLVGTAGLAISMVLFGVSKTYGAMIASRCIGGMLGGTYSTLRVMLAEVTDKSQAGIAYGGFTIAYRMGQIVGQPIGGLMSHPERHFVSFDTPFWNEYPFALPCFASAAFAVVAVSLGCVFTNETLASRKSKVVTAPALRTTPATPNPLRDERSAKDRQTWRHYLDRSLYTPHLLSVLMCTSTMCLTSEVLFAVYPLFAFTPITSGGLGLSEAQIGAHMALRSLNNVAVMALYTPLHNRLGAVRTLKLAMLFWPISVAFMPLLNIMARRGMIDTVAFNTLLGVFFTVWSFAGICWSALGIVTNDASPSASTLATVNSMSQMVSSLCLGIAPAFITSLFAFSIKSPMLGGNIVWFLMFGIALMGTLQCMTLQDTSHDWRDEDKPTISY